MMLGLSKALMTLAIGSLGESRRDWALAMKSEFDAAIKDGAPLPFAAGCLIAAWRELPRHAEGRLAVANYALAIGLFIPMGVILIGQVGGLPLLLTGSADGSSTAGTNANPYLTWSRLSAAPMLLALWLLLGIAHLGLAWAVVEQDWSRVVKIGALIGAAVLTLFLLMGILFIDVEALVPQVMAMAAELGALTLVARSHARLVSGTSSELIA